MDPVVVPRCVQNGSEMEGNLQRNLVKTRCGILSNAASRSATCTIFLKCPKTISFVLKKETSSRERERSCPGNTFTS
jgi:hypothetical protein